MTDPLPRTPDTWLQTLDHVLRGGFVATRDPSGELLALPARRLLALGIVLGVLAGACAGAFALFPATIRAVRGPRLRREG